MKISNNMNIHQNYNNPSREIKKESSKHEPQETFSKTASECLDTLSDYARNAIGQPIKGFANGGAIGACATFKALGGGEYASGTHNVIAGAAGLAGGVAGMAIGGTIGLVAGLAGLDVNWNLIGTRLY